MSGPLTENINKPLIKPYNKTETTLRHAFPKLGIGLKKINQSREYIFQLPETVL